MKAHEYIISKQTQWALNRGISLIGSKGCKGFPAYTPELNQNLFKPLDPDVCNSFLRADGKEISGSPCNPAKMQAVHSSSALSVNVFQYWKKIKQVDVIAVACGFCQKENCPSLEIRFEDKFPIDGIPRIPPNIDVVFHNSDSSQFKRFAVECKFSEPYGLHGDKGLKPAYVDLVTLWSDVPKLYDLAKKICPNDNCFTYLHSAQLIKHILGLKTACGKEGFKLLYLWYDVFGREGAIHRDEIEKFADVARTDGVHFDAKSYQELILAMSNEYRSDHTDYIKYLTERYL